MTAERFRECLAAINWSRGVLADHLQVGRETVGSWARGKSMIAAHLAAWMEACAAGRLDPETTWPDGWWNGRERRQEGGEQT